MTEFDEANRRERVNQILADKRKSFNDAIASGNHELADKLGNEYSALKIELETPDEIEDDIVKYIKRRKHG